MNTTVTTQIQMVLKIQIIYTTIMIIGTIIAEYVKNMSSDVALEECLFVYPTLGYVMTEQTVMMGKQRKYYLTSTKSIKLK